MTIGKQWKWIDTITDEQAKHWLIEGLWSMADQRVAMYEGWRLAITEEDGWHIQTANRSKFPANMLAVNYVSVKADNDSELHKRALVTVARAAMSGLKLNDKWREAAGDD